MTKTRKIPPTGILQPWVAKLGLRHQGCLLTVIRGCDTAPKDDPSKLLTRCIRSMILYTHCEDASKAVSFIEECPSMVLQLRMDAFRKNLDHYPHHYIMHVIHAVGIIGYKYPGHKAGQWLDFYGALCKGLHMNPETPKQMDDRLNADEKSFEKLQKG